MRIGENGRLGRRDLLRGAGLLGLATLTSPASAQTAAGRVTAVSGDAVAQLRQERRALAQDGPVFVGDRVATGDGARAALRLGQATELRLGERTRVTIDRFITEAGGTITLGDGALLLDRAPGSPDQVRIRSSYGLIAVRGTRLFAGPSNGVFGVFVQRGSVSVAAAGRTVVLQAGEGTDIARRGAAPTAPKAWGEARIRAALAAVA